MDEPWQRRLCDLVTGAAGAGVVVGLALAEWRGLLLCAAAVVIAQVIRAEV